jgi:transposase
MTACGCQGGVRRAHTPKRQPLPANLPRHEIRHEPESTTCRTSGCDCQMQRIGEDVAEKLDYVPGVFTVERHIRGKWACTKCETITQAATACCTPTRHQCRCSNQARERRTGPTCGPLRTGCLRRHEGRGV